MDDEVDVTWDVRSVIAYALAAGATPAQDLRWVYEAGGLRVFPAFAAHLLRRWIPARVRHLRAHGWPAQLIAAEEWRLHGEAVPPEGRAKLSWEVVSEVPWRRGVATSLRAELAVDGVTLISGQTTAASREVPPGYPLRGPEPGVQPSLRTLTVPDGEPACRVAVQTAENQSALFRLALDLRAGAEPTDAIHIDPAAARALGLPAPVLHGAHTEALIARAVAAATSLTPAAARIEYLKTVRAGEPLRLDLWREGPSAVLARLSDETGQDRALARFCGRSA